MMSNAVVKFQLIDWLKDLPWVEMVAVVTAILTWRVVAHTKRSANAANEQTQLQKSQFEPRFDNSILELVRYPKTEHEKTEHKLVLVNDGGEAHYIHLYCDQLTRWHPNATPKNVGRFEPIVLKANRAVVKLYSCGWLPVRGQGFRIVIEYRDFFGEKHRYWLIARAFVEGAHGEGFKYSIDRYSPKDGEELPESATENWPW